MTAPTEQSIPHQTRAAGTGAEKAGPAGLLLQGTLHRHDRRVFAIAWSPDGSGLAYVLEDGSVGLWDLRSGSFRTLRAALFSEIVGISWSASGRFLSVATVAGAVSLWDVASLRQTGSLKLDNPGYPKALWLGDGHLVSVGAKGAITVWDAATGRPARLYRQDLERVRYFALSPDDRYLALACDDASIVLFDLTDAAIRHRLTGHRDQVYSLAWAPGRGGILASASRDGAIQIWNAPAGRRQKLLAERSLPSYALAFSRDLRFFADLTENGTLTLWRTDRWERVAEVPGLQRNSLDAISFNPRAPLLATPGLEPTAVCVWELKAPVLLGLAEEPEAVPLRLARIVVSAASQAVTAALAGENRRGPSPAETAKVLTLPPDFVSTPAGPEQRQAFLHTLPLGAEAAVLLPLALRRAQAAVLILDAALIRQSSDALVMAATPWLKAVDLAQARRKPDDPPLARILVLAGSGPQAPVLPASWNETLSNKGFDAVLTASPEDETSLDSVRARLQTVVSWTSLVPLAPTLLADLERALDGVLDGKPGLVAAATLWRRFHDGQGGLFVEADLRRQFEAAVAALGARGLTLPLNEGRLIASPAMLGGSYAYALAQAAHQSADGLASLPLAQVLDGKVLEGRMNAAGRRLADPRPEAELLNALVETLVSEGIALRQSGPGGTQLIFPGLLGLGKPRLGPLLGISALFAIGERLDQTYASLALRLAQSDLFTGYRVFGDGITLTPRGGGSAGLASRATGGSGGELALFFDGETGAETRMMIDSLIEPHLRGWVGPEGWSRRSMLSCPSCGEVFPDHQVAARRERGAAWITCAVCDTKVPLQPEQETATTVPAFEAWAGGATATLALVFTDIVGSTDLGRRLGDERMEALRREHFAQGRRLARMHNGFEIKTMGDAFMIAFRTAVEALDFSLALSADTGAEEIRIRAGIDIGGLRISDGDAFGSVVNYAARLCAFGKGAEIWISERIKRDIDFEKSERHQGLVWERREIDADEHSLKGFSGRHVLWSPTRAAETGPAS